MPISPFSNGHLPTRPFLLLSSSTNTAISIALREAEGTRLIVLYTTQGGCRVRRMLHALFCPFSPRADFAHHCRAGIRQGRHCPSRKGASSAAVRCRPGRRSRAATDPHWAEPEPGGL